MTTILVVDDQIMSREFLTTLLGYCGYRLIEASDGKEGLAILQTDLPDLIISDILMPTMDGYAFVQNLRGYPRFSQIPIIFYTATYLSHEANLLAEACGVYCVIQKPAAPQLIINKVNEILGAKALNVPKVDEMSASSFYNYKYPSSLFEHIYKKINELKEIQISEHLSNKNVSEKPNLIITQLIQQITHLQAVSLRTSEVVDVIFKLLSEREPLNRLEMFLTEAHKIVGAEYSALGIFKEDQQVFRYYFTCEGQGTAQPSASIPINNQEFFKKITAERQPLLINTLDHTYSKIDFPQECPTGKRLLAIPIATQTQMYGVVYFSGKQDGSAFTDEDIQIAFTLATEIAMLYENAQLYALIQEHATKLQLEITHRQKIESSLIRSERQFASFAQNTDAVFWICSANLSEMIYVNSAYETVWGRSTKDLYQYPQHWLEAIDPYDRQFVQEKFAQLKKFQKCSFEFRIHHPVENIRWIHCRAFQIPEEDKNAYQIACIATDITDRKLNEKIAYQHQSNLAQIAKSNSIVEIGSMVAHELNQPLATITNFINGCLRRLESGSYQLPEIIAAMQTALKQAKLAADIIKRIRSSYQNLRNDELASINDIIRDSIALINHEINDHLITLHLEFTESLPNVKIDKIQITQVVINLIRNSIEAMREINSPTPCLVIRTVQLDKKNIGITIIDNGSGFAEVNIADLFNPYFTTKKYGMGMGLAISRTIIEAHSGTISANTLPEGGASFQFTLPIAEIEQIS